MLDLNQYYQPVGRGRSTDVISGFVCSPKSLGHAPSRPSARFFPSFIYRQSAAGTLKNVNSAAPAPSKASSRKLSRGRVMARRQTDQRVMLVAALRCSAVLRVIIINTVGTADGEVCALADSEGIEM